MERSRALVTMLLVAALCPVNHALEHQTKNSTLGHQESTPVRSRRGIMDNLIDRLPREMHLPGYNFCGPGTKLDERLARGESGVNPLDEACKRHDTAYMSRDLQHRRRADRRLKLEAMNRITSSDATLGERRAAVIVAKAMSFKKLFGI